MNKNQDEEGFESTKEDVELERTKLKELGVSDTWGVLKDAKKEDNEKKTKFRGFK